MKREDAIHGLKALMPQLQELGVTGLSLFGSVARDEAKDASDLDIIAEFKPPYTMRQYMNALFLIEDSLGVKVDLAEPDTLDPRMRDRILKEALRVA